MRLLSRTIFRENFNSAVLGVVLFTSVLFLPLAKDLFEYLVRSSSSPREVLYLFALVLPRTLPFAIPLGMLTGTLLTLSRMSADGEITAMRAAGVPGRRTAPPILTVGFLAMLVTGAASLWLDAVVDRGALPLSPPSYPQPNSPPTCSPRGLRRAVSESDSVRRRCE